MVSFIKGCSFVGFYNLKYFSAWHSLAKWEDALWNWNYDWHRLWHGTVVQICYCYSPTQETGNLKGRLNIDNFLVSTTHVLHCFIFQTISISMLLRYCHHQIFVFIGKSKLFFVKAVPKCYSYIVILVVISNKECIQQGSVVEQGECEWPVNLKEGQKRESPWKKLCHRDT